MNNDNVSLEPAIIFLRTSFMQKGHIKAYPEMATYTLSTKDINNQDLNVICTRPFEISKTKRLTEVKFDPRQVHLKDQQLRDFKYKLDHEYELTWNLKSRSSWQGFHLFHIDTNHCILRVLFAILTLPLRA